MRGNQKAGLIAPIFVLSEGFNRLVVMLTHIYLNQRGFSTIFLPKNLLIADFGFFINPEKNLIIAKETC